MPGSDFSNPSNYDEPQGQEFDLLRWVQLFWDNRWWIIGVTCAAVIVAALYSFMSTPVYSATAIVYVQSSNRTPLGMENPGSANSWMDQQKFYESQPDVIRSQAVMQIAAQQLGLAKNPAFKDVKDPWRALQGMVSVSPVRDSALFRITVTGPYKNQVADWANAVAAAYREETLTSTLDYIAKANKVMLNEARKMQEQYIKQQTQITKSLKQQGTYFPQNQKEILDKQIGALNDQLTDVGVKESQAAAVVTQMKHWERSGGDPLSIPAVANDPNVQDLARQYNEMSRDLAKLEVQFTPKHPEVEKKKAEMKDLKARIADQARIVLGTYQNQLAALQSEKSNLQAPARRGQEPGAAVRRGGVQGPGADHGRPGDQEIHGPALRQDEGTERQRVAPEQQHPGPGPCPSARWADQAEKDHEHPARLHAGAHALGGVGGGVPVHRHDHQDRRGRGEPARHEPADHDPRPWRRRRSGPRSRPSRRCGRHWSTPARTCRRT